MALPVPVWVDTEDLADEVRPIEAPAADAVAGRVIRLASVVEVLSELAQACSELGADEAAANIRRFARTPEAGLTWTRSPPEGEPPERTLARLVKQVTGPAPWLRRAQRLLLEERYP